MSTATFVFTDTERGTVNIEMDFEPPITDATTSDAQLMALRLLEQLKAQPGVHTERTNMPEELE